MPVYIAYHKEYPILTEDPVYVPLHVGKAISSNELAYVGDNTGDHISEKNKNYSELTGLYWIWKNTNSEIVGMSHYRRFFFSKKPDLAMQTKKLAEKLIGQGKKRYGIYYTSKMAHTEFIIGGNEIKNILSDFDAIIPLGRRINCSIWEQYNKRHKIDDLKTAKQIIFEFFPSYMDAFNQVMEKKEIYACNMFIMKRKFFDTYMEWLFTILFELERRTDFSDYDNYQKRIFGFISERLFGVWLTEQKLKYKPIPVLYFKKLKV